MTLRLDPPELGQLRVDVRMDDQVLTVRFETQTQAGQEALKGRLTDLRDALERQGIQVNRMEVELRQPAPAQHDPSSNGTPHRDDTSAGQGFTQPPPNDGGSSSGGQAGGSAPPEWSPDQDTTAPDPWQATPAEGLEPTLAGVDLVA
jgi:hypothetical protein